MSKKKTHDTTKIKNELEQSAFFRRPKQAPTKQDVQTPTQVDRSDIRPPDRPIGKRPKTRRAFELYTDQIETLKKMAGIEIAHGGEGNMSEWVREALDNFIADKRERESLDVRSVDRAGDAS